MRAIQAVISPTKKRSSFRTAPPNNWKDTTRGRTEGPSPATTGEVTRGRHNSTASNYPTFSREEGKTEPRGRNQQTAPSLIGNLLLSKKLRNTLGNLGVTPMDPQHGITGTLVQHAKKWGRLQVNYAS